MLYGMLHALGPGHRKTVLFSYFISAGGKWWHGIAAGIGLAVVHAGSALVAVFAIHSILQATFSGSLNNVQRLMETISYLAIAVMGILLFLHAIREDREHAGNGGRTRSRRRAEPLFIVLSAGIVPCPGAATLLIFGITLQAIPLAVAALLSMSLGMGITLSAVGVLTLTMKEGLLQLIGGGRRTERVASVLEVAGALFILLFGLFMGLPPLLAGL
jgi:ABC-type nickel/cobalt efflux system permease component RcnA